MCFTNLPVEFDEDGNPYLAEDAEPVDRPTPDSGGPQADDEPLEIDPMQAYDELLDAVSDDVRTRLGRPAKPPDADSAEGD